ncbi:MAG TPA: NAD-dependent epimerase/dehydratase family protein [Rhodoblastus sp.]|nr:NAD-dependent epimerase/dehydratase family protein [Rhodoblastus sp.]
MEIKERSFLVTGGASLIGSHIAEELLEGGASRIALFDNYALGSPDQVRHLLGDKRIQLIRGDILRMNEIYDCLEGIDGVFHVAGYLSIPLYENPTVGLDVNVRGMQNVLEACRYRSVKKVVFSSTGAVYGAGDGKEFLEDTPLYWQNIHPGVAMYACTKIIGECLLKVYKERYGIDYVNLRYTSVYGARQHYRAVNALRIMQNYDRIKRGEPPHKQEGDPVQDYIYASDVAKANILAMANEGANGQAFNICADVDTPMSEVLEALIAATGTDLKPIDAEETGVKLTLTKSLHYRRDRAAEVLGWKPQVPMREGIEKFIEWNEREAAGK